MSGKEAQRIPDLPFDRCHLDSLLGDAGIDVLLVTAKHNIQYLLGGYRYLFFDHFDALGISRYLPILIYPREAPEDTVYIGNEMEVSEAENGRFWCSTVETVCWGTLDATALAVHHLRRLGLTAARIGVEHAFLPTDASDALRRVIPSDNIVEAHMPLERLRAVKRPDELRSIKQASERVVQAMQATFRQLRPGMTKQQLHDILRHEELIRGLNFDYCLITSGTSYNRAPSSALIAAGDIVSLDSGGSYEGYVGDVCRMGIAGEADPELEQLLGWIETIQQAARVPVRAGTAGRMIFAAVQDLLEDSPHADRTHFVAHGMGIIGHEAPRLSDRGPVPYPAYDTDLPLQEGMVLSIETTLKHPRRGYIKLEDTIVVTETGWEAFGDGARGWNGGLA